MSPSIYIDLLPKSRLSEQPDGFGRVHTMKLSYKWLNEFIRIDDIDPDEIALKLTMCTSEIEEVEEPEPAPTPTPPPRPPG